MSKIAENLVSCELTSFIERFNHLPSFQHGFRSKRSVDSLMTEMLDDITRAIELKLNCDIIYFDIAKAFGTIEICRIITKLSNIGITGNLLSWLKNFLSDRQIRVSVNGTLSNKFSAFINRGVPQGSVLGPLIFNLYMADVAANFPHFNDIKAYADDHKAYYIYDTIPTLNPLQLFIDHFHNWCIENGLRILSMK